jgi:hypothetical protein
VTTVPEGGGKGSQGGWPEAAVQIVKKTLAATGPRRRKGEFARMTMSFAASDTSPF